MVVKFLKKAFLTCILLSVSLTVYANPVVFIENTQGGWTGSGFVVTNDGLILTAKHVVGNAHVLRVTYNNQVYVGIVIKKSHLDAASIKISANSPDYLEIDTTATRGTYVMKGYPLGVYREFSGTFVTSRHSSYIEVNGRLCHGNSGGPIIHKGKAIGIEVAGAAPEKGGCFNQGLALNLRDLTDLLRM